MVADTIQPLHALLIADLVADLPVAVRLQRLVESLRAHFRCGAVALLKLEEDHLRPLAVDGLVSDALGRRFAVKDHPRLAAILQRRDITRFAHEDTSLPDPYDGLIAAREGEPLPVHDCMGLRVEVEGETWGVLTFDALDIGTFDADAQTDLASLAAYVEAAVRVTRLEADIRALRETQGSGRTPAVIREDHDIVGHSPAMLRLLHEISVVADSELPVLLLGETGVGKELVAHRLHQLSRRRARPIVHVNCAALPETLAESELFGHVRGAYSGAISDRPGRFEAAEGGTLFLDEVGELPLGVQAKLLRTLQNGEIQRLGADHPRRVDVRVIAATNRSLRMLVSEGSFRADLYHRLSVYPIPIPPLRERGNDVLVLAGRHLEANRARLGLRSLRLAPDAEEALKRYAWPGNVRELEHVISRAALKAVSRGAHRSDIVTLSTDLLDLDDGVAAGQDGSIGVLRDGMTADRPHGAIPDREDSPASSGVPAFAGRPQSQRSMQDVVESSQRDAIRAALGRNDDNWAAAARDLGLDPSNLHKLARRLGMKGAATAAARPAPPVHEA